MSAARDNLPPEAYGVELDPPPPWAREKRALADADRNLAEIEAQADEEPLSMRLARLDTMARASTEEPAWLAKGVTAAPASAGQCADCSAVFDHGGGRCERHDKTDAEPDDAHTCRPGCAIAAEYNITTHGGECDARPMDERFTAVAKHVDAGMSDAALVAANEQEARASFVGDRAALIAEARARRASAEALYNPDVEGVSVAWIEAMAVSAEDVPRLIGALEAEQRLSARLRETRKHMSDANREIAKEYKEALSYLSGDAPDIARAHGLAQGIQRHTYLLVAQGNTEAEAMRKAFAEEREGLEGDKGRLAADLAAAKAELERLGRVCASLRQERDSWQNLAETNADMARGAFATVERMKPVVEAAEIWRQGGDRGELKAAVDAYSDGQSATTERSDLRGLPEREAQ